MLHIEISTLLRDAPETDQLDLLFAAFADLLDQECLDQHQTKQALHILDYLRDNLRADHPSHFNLAFRKFYHALHRLIIDAHGDGSKERLSEARRAILKLTSPQYGFEFLRNCIDESTFARDDMAKILVTLIGPQRLARLQPGSIRLH
jgi:hypothetical protein